MLKKVMAVSLAAAMLAGVLAGCGGGGAAPGGAGDAPAASGEQNAPARASMDELLSMSWSEIEAQAKDEGSLVLTVWDNEPGWNQTASVFEDRYGVKVTLVIGDKSTVMNKVIAELSGSGSMDVMMLAGETVNGLMNANALTPGVLDIMEHKDKLMPGISQRKEGVSNEAGYWVPICVNPGGFLYNPRNVPNPPQTWEEFEAYIDENPMKLGFTIPEKGGTGQAMMETIIANLTGGLDQYLLDDEVDPEKHASWDVVWEWIEARKDKITFVTSNSDGYSRVNSGEIDMAVAWNSGVKSIVDSGEIFKDYGFYVPEFGLCYSGDVLAIPRNASSPAASLLFLNWMTSEEAQLAAAEYLQYCPSRTDISVDVALLPEGEQEKNVDWMSAVYKTQYIADFTKYILQ